MVDIRLWKRRRKLIILFSIIAFQLFLFIIYGFLCIGFKRVKYLDNGNIIYQKHEYYFCDDAYVYGGYEPDGIAAKRISFFAPYLNIFYCDMFFAKTKNNPEVIIRHPLVYYRSDIDYRECDYDVRISIYNTKYKEWDRKNVGVYSMNDLIDGEVNLNFEINLCQKYIDLSNKDYLNVDILMAIEEYEGDLYLITNGDKVYKASTLLNELLKDELII